jgi:hypothetical protein
MQPCRSPHPAIRCLRAANGADDLAILDEQDVAPRAITSSRVGITPWGVIRKRSTVPLLAFAPNKTNGPEHPRDQLGAAAHHSGQCQPHRAQPPLGLQPTAPFHIEAAQKARQLRTKPLLARLDRASAATAAIDSRSRKPENPSRVPSNVKPRRSTAKMCAVSNIVGLAPPFRRP